MQHPDSESEISESSSGSSDSEAEGNELEDDYGDRAADSIAVLTSRNCAVTPAGNADEDVAQHRKLKTLHLASSNDADMMACGRKITDAFSVIGEMPTFGWPKCKICFGKE